MNENRKQFRPANEIDLQVMTTEPLISSEFMPEGIKNKFRDLEVINNRLMITKDYWSTIDLFTRDNRLGNLDKLELYYFRYQMNLCSDILTTMPDEFKRSAFLILERAVCCVESSNSKNGFLRRLFNSLFQHQIQTIKDEQPKKTNFFNWGNKGERL